jgi:phosphopantetheinyl transferase
MPLHTVLKYKNETSVTNDVTEVYIWHIVENEEYLMSLVNKDTLSELQNKNLINARRRIEWLATRALLHSVYPDAQIKYYPCGKPYLHNAFGKKCLSISHTEAWVALAISSQPIGIDIERWSDRPFHLAQRFLSHKEMLQLNNDEFPQTLATRLWTAKEAAFKYFDQSTTRVITDITIHQSAQSQSTLLAQGLGQDDKCLVHQIDFEHFAMSICVPTFLEQISPNNTSFVK